jgi:hypothetical protein
MNEWMNELNVLEPKLYLVKTQIDSCRFSPQLPTTVSHCYKLISDLCSMVFQIFQNLAPVYFLTPLHCSSASPSPSFSEPVLQVILLHPKVVVFLLAHWLPSKYNALSANVFLQSSYNSPCHILSISQVQQLRLVNNILEPPLVNDSVGSLRKCSSNLKILELFCYFTE